MRFSLVLCVTGSYNTITFTEDDMMPSCFNQQEPSEPSSAEKLCCITGLPAKYKDPLTGKPYATIDAFKEIRRQHAKQSKKKEKGGSTSAAYMIE
jgi:hypothetical protein